MQSTKEIIKNKNHTIDYSRTELQRTIVYSSNKITIKEADGIIESVLDLIDNQDYKPFFYKRLYEQGKHEFLQKAYLARKAKNNNGKFFCSLLKENS